MGDHLHIYCWDEDNNVVGRGAGGQSSWANIYLKLVFSLLFIPISDSVSFRQLPWDSVDFRRLSATISTYIVGMKTKMYDGRGDGAKVLEPIFT